MSGSGEDRISQAVPQPSVPALALVNFFSGDTGSRLLRVALPAAEVVRCVRKDVSIGSDNQRGDRR